MLYHGIQSTPSEQSNDREYSRDKVHFGGAVHECKSIASLMDSFVQTGLVTDGTKCSENKVSD